MIKLYQLNKIYLNCAIYLVQMQQLLQEQASLQQLAQKYQKQMIELQQINSQHENQIDTLLKFNEKLLNIIQKQLNGQKLKNSDILSLQPISQKTQIQSEMFQSQFSNLGGMGGMGNQMLLKRTMNLKPDPVQQRHKVGPLAIVQRQQQLSIDVQGNQKQQIEQNQVKNLIKQFYKKPKFQKEQLSFQQIEKKLKQDAQQLKNFRKEAVQVADSQLIKIKKFKNSISQINPKEKIAEMLQKLNVSDKTNKVLHGYISAL